MQSLNPFNQSTRSQLYFSGKWYWLVGSWIFNKLFKLFLIGKTQQGTGLSHWLTTPPLSLCLSINLLYHTAGRAEPQQHHSINISSVHLCTRSNVSRFHLLSRLHIHSFTQWFTQSLFHSIIYYLFWLASGSFILYPLCSIFIVVFIVFIVLPYCNKEKPSFTYC